MNKPCIQTRIILRKVQRHPVTRHIVRGAKIALVPDVINDIAFHNAHVNTEELVHAIQDSVAISVINIILKLKI
jgi:hypothetical protein